MNTRIATANILMSKSTLHLDVADFHAHILPGADHGSYSVTESVKQLEMAAQYGVKRIVATPHFYPNTHTIQSFLARRDTACNMLAPAIFEGAPKISLGAEVLLCPGLERMPSLDKLFINETNSILLEMPFSGVSDECVLSVSRLVKSGVDVILAHADRYDMQTVEKMISVGARVQLNVAPICSVFARKKVRWLFDKRLVVAIGSDIHNLDKSAYKNFSKALLIMKDYSNFIKTESDKIFNASILK